MTAGYKSFFSPGRGLLAGGPLTPWQVRQVAEMVAAAAPWRAMSLPALQELVFGPTLPRAWQVWSAGHCPACRRDVRMYDWLCRALDLPWKVTCPHCQQQFPTNDFEAYYRSGLDANGCFQFALADRALLFNAEHADADDPLRSFGVDDGYGYRDGHHTWRFIGAYLIYGQWKQRVLAAVVTLADAYTVTGDRAYGDRAVVLLHRIADFYPRFSFAEQALIYEQPLRENDGYVSVWHDACEETRELALAYDRVIDVIADDNITLRDFLRRPAASVHQHIRQNVLLDALNSPAKMHCNYPRRPIAYCIIRTILNWDTERDALLAEIDDIIHYCTRCDGTSGEKGLAGYASFALTGLASFLAMYLEAQPQLLPAWLRAHPGLARAWRFHIDTWCLQRYYPSCGDAGHFARPATQYPALALPEAPRLGAQTLPRTRLAPSMLYFLFRLYQATEDVVYAQLLYRLNGSSTDDLPRTLHAVDEPAVQRAVAAVIADHGAEPQLSSVNLAEWHLALQRSGTGSHQRVLWLDYDSGGLHGHRDALNLGLFSHQLDLLPDFGYPPVGFAGGWYLPKSNWYTTTAAHNTVLVDRQDQNIVGWHCRRDRDYISECRPEVVATTTQWIDDGTCHGVRCAVQAYQQCSVYDRFAVLVDIDERHSYILDVFRVVGGNEHIRFLHSQFAELTTPDLTLSPAEEDFGPDAQMRDFRWHRNPAAQWSAEWSVDDRYGAGVGGNVRLRCTDLTDGADAGRCLAWVVWGHGQFPDQEAWIPRLMTRRAGDGAAGPLASCFVALIEAFDDQPQLAQITRRQQPNEMDVELEILLADGRTDFLCAANDPPEFSFRRTDHHGDRQRHPSATRSDR